VQQDVNAVEKHRAQAELVLPLLLHAPRHLLVGLGKIEQVRGAQLFSGHAFDQFVEMQRDQPTGHVSKGLEAVTVGLSNWEMIMIDKVKETTGKS
jgi:hypothetical protein